MDPADTDEVRDPMRDHARLAAARAGEDQEGAVAGRHGFALRGVQILEEALQRRGHHAIVPERDRLRARPPDPARRVKTSGRFVPGGGGRLGFSRPSGAGGVAHRLPLVGAAMKRILIVDDNSVVQDVLKEFFKERYQVQLAPNASQALSLIVRQPPDLVLLDVKMPGLDGLSLLKSLRETGVGMPIFLMTGYDSLQVAQEALTSGANAYLPKPFDLMHLDRLISEAIGTEESLPSAT